MQVRRYLSQIALLSALISSQAIGQQKLGYHDLAYYQGAEVILFTPWSVFETTLSSYAGPQKNFKKDILSTTWDLDQFHWNLSGVHLNASANFSTTQAPGSIDFHSTSSRIRVNVDQIGIKQYVERVVDGVLVRVWVEAECGPLTLTQTSATLDGHIAYQFNARDISTRLDRFNLQWPAQTWEVAPIRCTGPEGFPELLAQELRNRMTTAEQVQPWIQDAFAQEIQGEVDALVAKVKEPSALPVPDGTLPLELRFSRFETNDAGVLARANLIWDFSRTPARVRPLEIPRFPTDLPKNQASLIFYEDALTDLLIAEVGNLPRWTTANLNEQPEFVKLLNSCLLKLFLWPDLVHYNSNSPFWLRIGRPEIVGTRWTSNGSLVLNLQEVAWVQSLRNGYRWDYIALQGAATGTVTPKISRGRLTLSANISATGFKTSFGADYLAAFHPNQYLSDSVRQALLDQLNQQVGFSFQLPSFDLGPAGVARASSWWTLDDGLRAIPLSVQ